MTSATKKRKNIELPVAQFIAIIVLSISIFLIVDFGRRAATGYRVRREEAKLRLQLEALEETQQALIAQRDYVASDAYVEQIARNELKWSQSGESVIIIMATPEAAVQTPPPIEATIASSQAETPLEAWLDLFFPEARQ